MRAHYFIDNPVLVKDHPITFRRVIPDGIAVHEVTRVEVQISPDLRLLVRRLRDDATLLTGNYDGARVRWHQHPSREAPRTAHDILSADVEAALFLFRRRYVDPAAWTSVASALAHL